MGIYVEEAKNIEKEWKNFNGPYKNQLQIYNNIDEMHNDTHNSKLSLRAELIEKKYLDKNYSYFLARNFKKADHQTHPTYPECTERIINLLNKLDNNSPSATNIYFNNSNGAFKTVMPGEKPILSIGSFGCIDNEHINEDKNNVLGFLTAHETFHGLKGDLDYTMNQKKLKETYNSTAYEYLRATEKEADLSVFNTNLPYKEKKAILEGGKVFFAQNILDKQTSCSTTWNNPRKMVNDISAHPHHCERFAALVAAEQLLEKENSNTLKTLLNQKNYKES
jgi:hypothetical protein